MRLINSNLSLRLKIAVIVNNIKVYYKHKGYIYE